MAEAQLEAERLRSALDTVTAGSEAATLAAAQEQQRTLVRVAPKP